MFWLLHVRLFDFDIHSHFAGFFEIQREVENGTFLKIIQFIDTHDVQPPHLKGRFITCWDFDHAALGGSTTAGCRLYCWYPPGVTPRRPVTLPTLPWIPIHSSVNGVNGGPPCPPSPWAGSEPVKAVARDPARGWVQGHGLFPHDEPRAELQLRSVKSRTKWVVRQLDCSELGGLWNVPILMT